MNDEVVGENGGTTKGLALEITVALSTAVTIIEGVGQLIEAGQKYLPVAWKALNSAVQTIKDIIAGTDITPERQADLDNQMAAVNNAGAQLEADRIAEAEAAGLDTGLSKTSGNEPLASNGESTAAEKPAVDNPAGASGSTS